MREQWMADYEAAFLAANGHPCRLVPHGRGWYRIEHKEARPTYSHRKSELLEMTARLEQRVAGTTAPEAA